MPSPRGPMIRPLALVLSTIALVACADATGVSSVDLDVTPTADGLRLSNDSGADLFYQAVDMEVLAQWAGPSATAMCRDPDCPHVAPGTVVLVPWSAVLGWREETRRVGVSWWRVVPSGDGRWRVAAGDVQSRDVVVP